MFTPSRKFAWIALVALACVAAAQRPPSAAPPGSDAIKIPFESYTLPNGLTVILQGRATIGGITIREKALDEPATFLQRMGLGD